MLETLETLRDVNAYLGGTRVAQAMLNGLFMDGGEDIHGELIRSVCIACGYDRKNAQMAMLVTLNEASIHMGNTDKLMELKKGILEHAQY